MAHESHESHVIKRVTAIKMEHFLESPCFFYLNYINNKYLYILPNYYKLYILKTLEWEIIMKVSSSNFISSLRKIPRAKLWASENMVFTQVLTGISRIKKLISYTTNILATQSFWVTSAKDQFLPWIISTHFPRSNIILLWVRKWKIYEISYQSFIKLNRLKGEHL